MKLDVIVPIIKLLAIAENHQIVSLQGDARRVRRFSPTRKSGEFFLRFLFFTGPVFASTDLHPYLRVVRSTRPRI